MASALPPQPIIATDVAENLFVRCARCPSDRWHSVIARAREEDDDGSRQSHHDYEIIRCDGCMKVSFREAWETVVDDDAVFGDDTLYPKRAGRLARRVLRGSSGLPSKVAQIYEETVLAANDDLGVLAGIGVRTLVEAVCKHKRIKGNNLKERIDGLAKAGLLGGNEVRILHRLRFLGNKAAHETKRPTESELSAGLDIAEHLLTTVYLLARRARTLPPRGR